MKKFRKYFLAMFILAILQILYSSERVKLIQDLSIGVESGDENYIFGRISDIAVSPAGDIFVLDTAKMKVLKFSKDGKFLLSIGGKGQGPGEFSSYPLSIETDNDGNLIVAEFGKISIFSNDGEYLGSFRLDFQCGDFFIDDKNRIIVMGLKDGKIFHIYTREGEEIFSFRKPIDIPEEYSKYKEFPNMKLPLKVYFTRNKRLIYMNPYKYELLIFDKENQTKKRITHKSEFYKKPQVIKFERGQRGASLGVIFTDYSIFEDKNFMYVCLLGEKECQIDIFKNDKYWDSLRIKSFPQAMDDKGRIYARDETDFPKIIRFTLQIKDK